MILTEERDGRTYWICCHHCIHDGNMLHSFPCWECEQDEKDNH